MPRFHYGKSEQAATQETDELANFFAARDRAEFPYQSIAERTPELPGAARRRRIPNYLAAGWEMMTERARRASSATRSAQFKPTGGPEQSSTARTSARSRRGSGRIPETWIANPRRLVPYTAMPQNIAPHGAIQMPVPKTFENQPMEMVRAIRDTLLNYVNAVELQLASSNQDGRRAVQRAGDQDDEYAHRDSEESRGVLRFPTDTDSGAWHPGGARPDPDAMPVALEGNRCGMPSIIPHLE